MIKGNYYWITVKSQSDNSETHERKQDCERLFKAETDLSHYVPCWVLLRRRRECLDPVHCRKLPAQCSTDQLLCPAGFFCVVGTSDFISSACQAGYYCLAGVQIPGTYNPKTGSQTTTACIPCREILQCCGLSSPSGLCTVGCV